MEEVAVTGSSFDLTGAIHIMDPLSCQPGSHADLYLAKWKGSIVCAKVLRYIGRPSDEEARRALDTVITPCLQCILRSYMSDHSKRRGNLQFGPA